MRPKPVHMKKLKESEHRRLTDRKEEKDPEVSILSYIVWLAMAGSIVGGVPFLWPGNHGILVALAALVLFIIITLRPFEDKILEDQDFD